MVNTSINNSKFSDYNEEITIKKLSGIYLLKKFNKTKLLELAKYYRGTVYVKFKKKLNDVLNHE